MIQRACWFILIVVILASVPLHAGLFDDRFPSPKVTAMGGAGVAIISGVWSAYYNPAALSRIERPQVGTSYLRLFNVTYFKNFFGGGVYPISPKYGTVSVTMQYFGVDYKNQNISGEYTIALSHGFYLLNDIHSSLAVGYSVKAYHWSLGSSLLYGDLGSATTVGLDVGLQASVYSRTFVGIYLLNINTPQLGAYTKHELPQRVVIGVAYQPYDGVTTSVDINRVIGVGGVQVWGGAEFNVFRNLFLRFGGTTNPNRFSFGVGIQVAQFKVDYALLTHSELGETHQMGLMVGF